MLHRFFYGLDDMDVLPVTKPTGSAHSKQHKSTDPALILSSFTGGLWMEEA